MREEAQNKKNLNVQAGKAALRALNLGRLADTIAFTYHGKSV